MKINNKNKIVKNNSLSFISNGIKKQSLSFLIIILFINILLPFNIVFTQLDGVSLERNIVTAETTLEVAQKKLEEAKANLNKINLIIADLVEQIEIAKSKNQNTTQLENNLTIINRDTWAAANSEVIAAQKEVTKEEILAAAADGAVTVTPQTDTSSNNSKVYKLLAPIGEWKEAPEDIGSYFNTIFNIALGLCAVLAVIMIVIGGVQYMGDESIFGKTEAKERIKNAIFGLLIALGSYALLNTINPDLLGGRGVTIKSVSAEIQDEVETTPWEGSSSGDNKTLCPEGFQNILVPWGNPKKEINVCKSIITKLSSMLNDAKKAGYKLSGSGSRTKAEQQKIRVDNGCPDPTASSKSCRPETAQPGHSMHESGMAVDFKCDGKTLRAGDPCFIWLTENAISYGFKKLPSESWHWSTGPKAGH